MTPFTLIAVVPAWLLLKKKREPWVWTTLIVFICLNLFNSLIVFLPILIFWIKDNNKEYYGKLKNPQPPLSPTVKTPVESGKVQGTAGHP